MQEICPLKPGSTRRVVRRRVLCGSLLLCFVSFAFSHWVLWPVQVAGDSMTPNYQNGQPNYIYKLAYVSKAPQRGDVVGVRIAHGEFLLKRVIGLPGERIEFNRGTIVVNGRPLAEPYIEKPLLWALPSVQLGAEDYFVMGDNRAVSMLGAIAKDHIVGKALF
jgi:signal peptidase I